MLKREVRIIAWDDCGFRFAAKTVTLIGAIYRGASFMDGLLSTRIAKDGTDATEKIVERIISSRHHDQLSVIMLKGITFAGFNVADIKELSKSTRLPVLVVQRKKPDIKKFLAAMKMFGNYKARERAAKSAGRIYKYGKIFYQKAGLSRDECEKLLRLTCVRSDIPEPLRIAHIIASGMSGESRGRA